jgi:hypothetical protein
MLSEDYLHDVVRKAESIDLLRKDVEELTGTNAEQANSISVLKVDADQKVMFQQSNQELLSETKNLRKDLKKVTSQLESKQARTAKTRDVAMQTMPVKQRAPQRPKAQEGNAPSIGSNPNSNQALNNPVTNPANNPGQPSPAGPH